MGCDLQVVLAFLPPFGQHELVAEVECVLLLEPLGKPMAHHVEWGGESWQRA